MRPSQKQNRSRGKSSRKSVGNSINRVYESAGPEGKVRGTPQQIIDKYQALARDAQISDDRVAAENFLQHAEHYVRILLSVQPPATQPTQHSGPQPGPHSGQQPVERRDQPHPAPHASQQPEQQPQPGLQPQPNPAPPPATNGQAPNGTGDVIDPATADANGLATFDAPKSASAGLVRTAESMNRDGERAGGETSAPASGEPRRRPTRRSRQPRTAAAAPAENAPEAAAEPAEKTSDTGETPPQG